MTSSPEASPRVRLRRDPRWLFAGILAVALGGLATAFLVTSVSAADPVLRVNRTIHRGETIAPTDLSVVTVGRGVDVPTVPGERLDEVVGAAAVIDLAGGSLLVADSFGPGGLPAGKARLGVRLEAGRLPSAGLVPGAPLLVVALPAAGATGVADEALPASISATLATAPTQAPDGSYVVDLTLASERAEAVARLAATDRVAIVGVADR